MHSRGGGSDGSRGEMSIRERERAIRRKARNTFTARYARNKCHVTIAFKGLLWDRRGRGRCVERAARFLGDEVQWNVCWAG